MSDIHEEFKKYLNELPLESKTKEQYLRYLDLLLADHPDIFEFSNDQLNTLFEDYERQGKDRRVLINKIKEFKSKLQNATAAIASTQTTSTHRDEKPAEKTPIKKHPLNQILYGPPGTGKTYNTITTALEIIDGKIDSNRQKNKKRFDELLKQGNIVLTTFHQSLGYEDFIEGIKPKTEDGKISYNTEDGIFKKIAQKANKSRELYETQDETISFDDLYNELIVKPINNEDEIILETPARKVKFHAVRLENNGKHLVILSSTNTEWWLEYNIIKGFFEGTINNDSRRYSYFRGIDNYLKEKAKSFSKNDTLKNQTKNENFVIIIDEINRGNISKIFGELITLIEDSKRLGNPEELRVELANSQELFGVPNNLYIIGTMNTADRSLAQIDLALRRRFEFIPMYPDYTIWEDGNEVRKFLEELNDKISLHDSIEHTIGHAYFYQDGELIKEFSQLSDVFCYKILPLLEEYFFDNPEQIKKVIDGALFSKIYETISSNDNASKNITKYRKNDDWKSSVKSYFR